MAQRFVSPGVFTREIDLSFLAQGVAGIGAALVGRTQKGPAFVPIAVQGFSQFADRFGNPDPKFMVPYTAKNYLKNASVTTVVRVLGHADGLSTTNGFTVGGVTAIVDSGSLPNAQTLAYVIHSGAVAAVTATGVANDSNNFVFKVGTGFAVTASFLTSSANYVGKVLNTDPTLFDTYKHYLYSNFSYVTPCASASWSTVGVSGGLSSFARDFEGGSSAVVKSQPLGGTSYDLFSFNTLGHGRAENDNVKVMIANVKPSPSPLATPFGTFDVVVRSFADTDQHVTALETFSGCTLDQSSKNFVARRIGDVVEAFDTSQRKFVATGTYPSKSKLVSISMSTGVNVPAEALPWGHAGYAKLVWSSGSTTTSMPLATSQYDRNGNVDPNIAWGISFVSGGIVDRMRAFPNNSSGFQTSDSDFSLSFLSSSYVNGRQVWHYDTTLAQPSYHTPIYSSASLYKFSLPFLGGHDGFDIRVADPLYLTNVADETDIGVVSAKRAVDTIANPDAFDMNLLALPGIHNLKTTDHARQMVNDRGDAMYVMDITGSSVVEAVGNLRARDVDDNYTATYYPDLKIDDKLNNRIIRVSPSVAIMGAIAFSDRVSQVFFAPAGLNRGGLGQFDVVDVVDRLTFQDRNDLYDNRINPIATFPTEGIVVFGQKTLQIKASALDRINVRRLLIFAKKTIAAAAKLLLFESDNPQTWQRFVNVVNPILKKIQENQGLERFKVVMDSTTNTSDLVDRNIMTGKIFLQPTKATEFVDLSFIISNAGVSFDQ